MIPRHRPARCDGYAGSETTGLLWPNNGIESDELKRARFNSHLMPSLRHREDETIGHSMFNKFRQT